jgi:hypothetical protein
MNYLFVRKSKSEIFKKKKKNEMHPSLKYIYK